MSLILDALRKMEQERKTRHGAAVDIRPAVLDRHGNEPALPKSRLLIAGAGAALLLSGIAAGLLLRGGREEPARQPGQAVVATEARPVTPTPVPVTPPAEPVRPVPVPSAQPVPPPVRTVAADQQPAPSAEPSDRGITISGIAWQDERAQRRAVINGALVGEGADVAGARVVEIRERSVRFSRGDRTFEVTYSSAFPSR